MKRPTKGGLYVADFNFLLRMDDTSEGFNGWFHIVAPQTLAVPPDYEASDLLSDQFFLKAISIYSIPLSHPLFSPTDRNIQYMLLMATRYHERSQLTRQTCRLIFQRLSFNQRNRIRRRRILIDV